MQLRVGTPDDLAPVLALTIEVFGPFYENSFRGMVPPRVFEHQHGSWAQDYARQVPTLLDPENHRHVLVAEHNRAIVGFIAWHIDLDRRHGEIDMLAVSPAERRAGVGTDLCQHALRAMGEADVAVVELGTGGDDFHRPARRLYEKLGFSLVPVAVYLKALDELLVNEGGPPLPAAQSHSGRAG
jgi:ribosomal protein S18 acetylase RimI-like enzyme